MEIFCGIAINFYNFKRNVISSKYSSGSVTKDNLCVLFEIEGATAVHSSSNDCKLEWKLFEKMGGNFYLVTEGAGKDNVFRLNESYIVPVSLLHSHPNLSRWLKDRPYIECHSTLVKSFEVEAKGLFYLHLRGMTIEHLIGSMLGVEQQDSKPFLLKNKMKLDFVGSIPNEVRVGSMAFNPEETITTVVPMGYPDRTIAAVCKEDARIEQQISATHRKLKKQIQPLVDFIKRDIFKNEPIWAQELVIDSGNNILALCDLSSPNAVLEIKDNNYDAKTYKEQFFYVAKGRDVYHMQTEWAENLKKVIFHISRIDVHAGIPASTSWYRGQREEKRKKRLEELQQYLLPFNISVVDFKSTNSPIKLQCKICEYEWCRGYDTLMKKTPKCPNARHNFSHGQQSLKS